MGSPAHRVRAASIMPGEMSIPVTKPASGERLLEAADPAADVEQVSVLAQDAQPIEEAHDLVGGSREEASSPRE